MCTDIRDKKVRPIYILSDKPIPKIDTDKILKELEELIYILNCYLDDVVHFFITTHSSTCVL